MKLGWRHKTLPVERDTIRMMNLVLQLESVCQSFLWQRTIMLPFFLLPLVLSGPLRASVYFAIK